MIPAHNTNVKKKRRLLFRRKRTLDPTIIIDYKEPEHLKRFITDRGKIIPRRISGATAMQQREICKAVKRARYIGLLPFAVSHRQEKKAIVDIALAAAAAASRRPPMGRPPRQDFSDQNEGGDRGERSGGGEGNWDSSEDKN